MAPKVARTYNGEFPKLSFSTDMDGPFIFFHVWHVFVLISELSEYG